VQRPEKLF